MAPELKALNGLRFPACLLVFCQHLPAWSHPDHPWFAAIAPTVISQGHAAMPYFFLLSGFVLLHAYGAALLNPDGSFRPGGTRWFLRRRLIRLFPLHWLGLALMLPLAIAADSADWPALVAHLAMIQSLAPDIAIVAAFNAPSWSLSDELVFAVVFPPLALLLVAAPGRWRRILLALVVLAPLAAAMLLFLAAPQRSGLLPLYINPLARLADFVAGMLLYLLWRQHGWRLDGLRWEIAPMALFAAAIIAAPHLPAPFRHVALYLPALTLLTAVFVAGDGPLRRAMASARARALGRLAFAFYIVHFPLIRWVETTGLAELATDDPWRWALIPLLLVLSLLAALAVHHGVERTVEPWLRRRFSPARPAIS